MQYYNLIHLGFSGYREIMENCLTNARLLSKTLEATTWYKCASEIHKRNPHAKKSDKSPEGTTSAAYIAGLPVVSFHLSDRFKREYPHVKQESVSLLMRARQWIIPNYALPPNENQTDILRIVIRESMSLDLLDRLISDLVSVTESLMKSKEADLSALQHKDAGSAGSQADSKDSKQKKPVRGKAARRLEKGIHRTVC